MSKIIKSFRVIEENNKITAKKPRNKEEEILLNRAKKKYDSIVEQALEEANEIVEEANEKSDNYLNKAYLKSKEIFNEWKNKGYEEGYKAGYAEGYDKGYAEGKNDSNKLIEDALLIKNDYLKNRENICREMEEDVIQLVFSICEKIIYDKIEEDREYIVNIILKGIESLNPTEDLIIRVSTEDFDIVEMSKNKILVKASMINDLEVRADANLKKGDCIIETSKGSVDVSIEDQLIEVKELLNNILSSE